MTIDQVVCSGVAKTGSMDQEQLKLVRQDSRNDKILSWLMFSEGHCSHVLGKRFDGEANRIPSKVVSVSREHSSQCPKKSLIASHVVTSSRPPPGKHPE